MLNKTVIEGTYINIMQARYKKITADTILNCEKPEDIPLTSATRQEYLFNIVLEVLAREIRQEKEIKSTQIGKMEVKVSIFLDDIILYIYKNSKLSTKTLLEI